MKRRIFNILVAVSLLMCLATVVLWVRSYWIRDIWIYFDGGDPARGTELNLDGAIGRGKLLFQYQKTKWNEGVPGLKYVRREPPVGHVGFLWGSDPMGSDRIGGAWPPQFVGGRALWFNGGSELERSSASDSAAFQLQPGQPRLSACQRYDIGVPLWPVVVLTAVLPAWWAGQARTLRVRRKLGRCARCGYDLSATPMHCPECGAIPGGPTAA